MTSRVKVAPPLETSVRRASDATDCAASLTRGCALAPLRRNAQPSGLGTTDEWFRCCTRRCVAAVDYYLARLEAEQPEQLSLGDA